MKNFFLFLAITFIVSCSSDTNSTNDQNFIEENSSDIQSETTEHIAPSSRCVQSSVQSSNWQLPTGIVRQSKI